MASSAPQKLDELVPSSMQCLNLTLRDSLWNALLNELSEDVAQGLWSELSSLEQTFANQVYAILKKEMI